MIEALKRLVTDVSRVAEEVEGSFEKPGEYFRFSVDQGMQGVTLEEWNKIGDVRIHTEQYLLRPICQKVDQIVDLLIAGRAYDIATDAPKHTTTSNSAFSTDPAKRVINYTNEKLPSDQPTQDVIQRRISRAKNRYHKCYSIASLQSVDSKDETKYMTASDEAMENHRYSMVSPRDKEWMSTMKHIAFEHYAQGRMSDAESVMTDMLQLQKRLIGPDHPRTLSTRHNLAAACHAQGKFCLAEKLYKKTMKIRKRVLGPGHTNTLATMHNLSATYHSQRKFEAAEDLCMKTAVI